MIPLAACVTVIGELHVICDQLHPAHNGFAVMYAPETDPMDGLVDIYDSDLQLRKYRKMPRGFWPMGVTNRDELMLQEINRFYGGFARTEGANLVVPSEVPIVPTWRYENDAFLAVTRLGFVETLPSGQAIFFRTSDFYDRVSLGRSGAVGVLDARHWTVELRTVDGRIVRSRIRSEARASGWDWSSCNLNDKAFVSYFDLWGCKPIKGLRHLAWGPDASKGTPKEQVLGMVSCRTGRFQPILAVDYYDNRPGAVDPGRLDPFSITDVNDHEIAISCLEKVWLLDVRDELALLDQPSANGSDKQTPRRPTGQASKRTNKRRPNRPKGRSTGSTTIIWDGSDYLQGRQ